MISIHARQTENLNHLRTDAMDTEGRGVYNGVATVGKETSASTEARRAFHTAGKEVDQRQITPTGST